MSLYCDIPIPAYAQNVCANEEGRIIAIAYLRVDHAITDPTVKAQWTAAIADGTAIVIQNVRGEKPVGSPVTGDGFGRQKVKTISYDRTLTYSHPDVIGNEDFYNVLNFDNSHEIVYYTAGKKVWMPPVDEAPVVNVDADPAIEAGLDSAITFEVATSWASQKMHDAYDAPTGIFE
tara:strand:+ start:909 stop:1436 length:528 start_codon:yes stop_codon:yes gene_type:complete